MQDASHFAVTHSKCCIMHCYLVGAFIFSIHFRPSVNGNAKQNIIHFLDCGKLSFPSAASFLFQCDVIVVHFCAPFKTNWQSYKFKLNVLAFFLCRSLLLHFFQRNHIRGGKQTEEQYEEEPNVSGIQSFELTHKKKIAHYLDT